MWENVRDRSECDHDESERGVGGVKAVGPIDDETHAPIEAFVAGVVHAESHRRQDALAPLANGLGQGAEGLHAAALGSGTEPVEHQGDLDVGEVAREDRPQGLFQRVGAPQVTPSTFQLAQGDRLIVGQVTGVLQQAPPRPFEASGGVLIGELAQVLPDRSSDLFEGLGPRLDDVKWIETDQPWSRGLPSSRTSRRRAPCPSRSR